MKPGGLSIKIPPFYSTKWTRGERSNEDVAHTIEAKWREAGHPEVRAWVERVPMLVKDRLSGNMTTGYREIIRSNLVAGLPPQLSRKAAA